MGGGKRGEKSGGNSASTETQRRSREHGNGAEGGRNARDEEGGEEEGEGRKGGREACTCRQTLKWKQSEPSERVLWILPQLPSAHPFRPRYTEEGGKTLFLD